MKHATDRQIVLTTGESWRQITDWILPQLPPPRGVTYSWIYVCLDGHRKRFLEEAFLERHHQGGLVSPPFFTRSALLQRIILPLHPGARILTPREEQFWVHLICNRPGDPPLPAGLLKEIHRFVHTLRLNGFPEDQLPERPDAPQGLSLLHRVFQAYQKQKPADLLDAGDLLQRAISLLSPEVMDQLFPGLETVFWEIQDPLPAQTQRLLETLARSVPNLHLLIRYADHPDIFGNLNPLVESIKKQVTSSNSLPSSHPVTPSLYRLDGKTFQPKGKLHLLRLPHRLAEVEWVARKTKMFCVAEGLSPEEIGITAPHLDGYRPMLESVFRGHGIPIQWLAPERLDRSAIVQHLRLYLELVVENFPLHTVLKIFQSPYLSYRDRLAGTDVEGVLQRLRVWTGLEVMLKQIQRFLDSDILQTDRENETPEGVLSLPEQFARVKQCLEQLQKETAPLSARPGGQEFLQFLENIIQQHQINQRLLETAEALSLDVAAQHLSALRTLLEQVQAWAQFLETIDPAARFNAPQILQLFDLLIQTTPFRSPLPKPAGVQVYPLAEVHSHSVQVLFVMGMTDQDFPTGESTPFGHLPAPLDRLFPQQQIFRDRQMFVECLHRPDRQLFFTYPHRDGETVNVPSELLQELARVSGVPIQEPEPLPVLSRAEWLSFLEQAEAETRSRKEAPSIIPRLKKWVNFSLYQLKKPIVLQRAQFQPPAHYEGLLTGNPTIRAYLNWYYPQHPFSASALELFARCPQLFFFQRVLGLVPAEDMTETLTPLEKGNLVHQVLFRFFTEIPETERSLHALLQIAEAELQKLPFPSGMLWELQKAAFLGNEHRQGLFAAFWSQEEERLQDEPFTPTHFELPFGYRPPRPNREFPESEPFVLEWQGQRMALRGVVDRVDLHPNRAFLIIDYKTGSHPGPRDVVKGLSLQLPLYLLAMESLLQARHPGTRPLGAAYYKISSENDIRLTHFLFDPDMAHRLGLSWRSPAFLDAYDQPLSFRQILERSLAWAFRYYQSIREGRFTHTTDPAHCTPGQRRCPFEAMCRVNPYKIRHLARQENQQTPDPAAGATE
ncbi:MAG: hypothetical protein GXO78_08070 [Calditrichaeota bacterium]|nr:hypothetical protein [Calditrichota bacterium]